MWGPRSIAKLVHITPITMVYGMQITITIVTISWFMVLITIVTGALVNQLITGGPHIAAMCSHFYREACTGDNIQMG